MLRVTETFPTAITGSPESSLAQPARVRSLPSKPGARASRVLTWRRLTPASLRDVTQVPSSSGVRHFCSS